MFVRIFLRLLSTSAAFVFIDLNSCPKGSTMFLNKCFKVKDKTRLSWPDASAACQKMGGNLVSVGSETEQRFLRDLIDGRTRSEVKSDYWTGA